MKLTVVLENYAGDKVSGGIVEISAPEYNYTAHGSASDSNGVSEFDLPHTFNDEIFVHIYVNGVKKWSDRVPSYGDTIYLQIS